MTDITFQSFGLEKTLLNALERSGFTTPTPIQKLSIKAQLEGRDILGVAQTGTGKTAAFGLPILHNILQMQGRPSPKSCRALILAPTRELAVQIEDNFKEFAGGAGLTTCLVLGGVSRAGQVKKIARGVDVVIATPGRLEDLMNDKKIRLDEVRFVVLDEADRMLDMGFVQPVKRILARLHPRRQSALFSATMPKEVRGLAESFLTDPLRVEATPTVTAAPKVEQRAELITGPYKRERLLEILSQPEVERTIVFARTKRGADKVAKNLITDGIEAEVIHGNKAQNARQKALGKFKNGFVNVLVATDIVARGIDVPGISHVINFDLPDEAENYVHRIGRTGRNGASGISITLCAPDELKKLAAVEKILKRKLIERDGPDPKPKPKAQGWQGKKRGGGGGRPGGRPGGNAGGGNPAGRTNPKRRRPNRSKSGGRPQGNAAS